MVEQPQDLALNNMKLSYFNLTLYFFWFTVVILAMFGIGSLLRINTNPERSALYIFYGLAMWSDAVALAYCAWQLNKRKKLVFYLSVVVLALNIFPTVFDQFGLVDLFFVLLNLITLTFLILARKDFLTA
jgi:hypothetical protein